MADQAPAAKPGFLRRAAQAVAYTITGIDAQTWMSPLQPLHPMAEQTKGRVWDYPVAYNLNYIPRSTEPLSFLKLKGLAEYGIVREVIQTRIDQVCSMPWIVRAKEAKKGKRTKQDQYATQIEEVRAFLEYPDKRLDWNQWLAQGLEQHYVYDGWAIEKQRTRAGKPYAWPIVDAATIKLLIDGDGRPHPPPPSPAYQQVLKGMPTSNYTSSSLDQDGPKFTTSDMLYMAKNVRVDRAYGFPPVAQIATYVEMCIARAQEQLAEYTHGNQPIGVIQAPQGLTSEQIAALQSYWDSMYQGNIQQRRRLLWVPFGSKLEASSRELLFDEFDEWLARVVCYAFSISPQPFVKMMNRGTAQTAQETASEEGLQPTLKFVGRLINRLLQQEFQYPFLEFAWNTDNEFDPAKKAIQDNTYARLGALALDDVRDDIGLDPLGGAFATPMYATPNGWVPVGPEEAQAMRQPPMLPGQGGQEGPNSAAKPGQPQPGAKPPPKNGANTPPGQNKGETKNVGKSLIVSRPLLNGHELAAWAKSQGLQAPEEVTSMKVILTYSRQAVDWESLDQAASVTVIDEGDRALKLGADGSLMLAFESAEFVARWGDIIARGAGCDTLDFQPSIVVAKSATVSGTVLEKEVSAPRERTLGDITVFKGSLIFGPEEWSEIDDPFQRALAKLDRADVDQAASEADGNPSHAQIAAGNYRKGHVKIQGLDISIENEAGSKRRGVDDKGAPWEVTMPTHYGYIKRTEGADGDHVDCYLGPNPESKNVWVVDQADAGNGEFDEHKAMIGYDNWRDAQQDYLAAFSDGKGARRLGAVTAMSMDEFKQWLAEGDTTKPLAMKSVTVGTGLTHYDQGAGHRAAPFQNGSTGKPSPYPSGSPDVGNFDTRADIHDGPGYQQRMVKVYNSVSDLPQAVKDKIKSPKRRRQWMHVWNSVYAQTKDEGRAFAAAWAQTEAAGGVKKSHAVLEPGPQAGDVIEVKSDIGEHSNAPWSSHVIEGDDYSARIEYDDGAEWHHFEPANLEEVRPREDGSNHWVFSKVAHITPYAIDWAKARKVIAERLGG